MVILRGKILQSGLILNRCYGVFHGVKVFRVYCTSKGSSNEGRIYEGLKKFITSSQSRGVFIGKKIFVWFKFAPPCIV